jgi:hypothetical protein
MVWQMGHWAWSCAACRIVVSRALPTSVEPELPATNGAPMDATPAELAAGAS